MRSQAIKDLSMLFANAIVWLQPPTEMETKRGPQIEID